jgi:hypothetical protein
VIRYTTSNLSNVYYSVNQFDMDYGFLYRMFIYYKALLEIPWKVLSGKLLVIGSVCLMGIHLVKEES